MKKIMLFTIIALAALLIQSCHKIEGDGPIVSRSLTPADFTAISADLDADIYYTQDNFYKVEVLAQQNIQNIIQTQVENGMLYLQFEKYKNVWRHSRITIYITAPDISNLAVTGSGDIRTTQQLHSENMSLEVSGSGSITLAALTGKTLSAEINGSGNITVNGGALQSEAIYINGSGNVNLLGAAAAYATCKTSGSGNTSLHVDENLNVHISGSGSVYYSGDPSIICIISGSGKIKHL